MTETLDSETREIICERRNVKLCNVNTVKNSRKHSLVN